MKIAWIGTGVMGKAMAFHLQNGGYDVYAYNRTYEKAKNMMEQGVHVVKSVKECVQDAAYIFTMVGYPNDVEEIYTGAQGIFKNVKKGAVLIDMTTSSPTLAKALYQRAKEYGVTMLDAPVSGGDSGAKNATLSIMVGGERDVYDTCLPLFHLMGKTIHYMGDAGNGQHTKACNQIAVAGAVAAMSEALCYASENGVDAQAMLQAISGGAAGSWQIENTAPRVIQHDYAPGFYIKHFIKDMHIIQEGMQHTTISLNMLNSVCTMYETLARNGLENDGTQALIEYYKKFQ